MRALTAKISATPGALRWVALVCAAPFIQGLWLVLRKSDGAALLDLNAVLCAGDAWLAHASLYAKSEACPFGPHMPYVYPPPLAVAMGTLQHKYGLSFELTLAGALCGLGLAAVVRALLAGPLSAQVFRAPFFCALTARALFSGNVSLVFHAAILLAAVHAEFLLLPLIVACAICKPTFAVYAALFLFLERPVVVRIALAGACLMAIAAYYAGFRAFDPDGFQAWVAAARDMGLAMPGHSFLALPGIVALPDAVRFGLYALFAAGLLAAGLMARGRLDERDRARVLAGVAVCVLLNPRLMYYDHLALPFGMGVISQHLASANAKRRAIVGAALAAMWIAVVSFAGVKGGEILFLACVGLICACAFLPDASPAEETNLG